MPNFDIIRESSPKKTFRVASVMGTYDLQTNAIKEHFQGNIDLPDYQGLGIGLILRNYVSQKFVDEGKGVITTTSNPAMIASLKKSPLWVATRFWRTSSGSGSGKIQNRNVKGSTSCARITASFQYIGKPTNK